MKPSPAPWATRPTGSGGLVRPRHGMSETAGAASGRRGLNDSDWSSEAPGEHRDESQALEESSQLSGPSCRRAGDLDGPFERRPRADDGLAEARRVPLSRLSLGRVLPLVSGLSR